MGGMSQGSSSSSSSAKTKQQKEALTQMLDTYLPYLGTNDNVYQGDRVADMNDLQTGALDGAEAYTSLFSNPASVSTSLKDQTTKATEGLLGGTLGATNISQEQADDYFQNNIYDPTMQTLNESTLPGIDEGYAGEGFWSSGRTKAREKAITDTQNELTQQKADLNWNVLQNNQALDEAKADRALSSLSSALAVGQQDYVEAQNNLDLWQTQLSGLSDILGIGSEQQTQDQAELESQITQWAEENQITDPTILSILQALVGVNMSQSSGSSSSIGVQIA